VQVGRKGTMAATAPATPAASQMVLRGEDNGPSLHVKISRRGRKGGDRAAARGEFLPGDLGMGGDRLETATAKATLFWQIGQDPLETGVQEDRAFTPARTLVRLPRFEPAAIGRGTYWTAPGAHTDAQKIEGGRRGASGGGGKLGKCSAHGGWRFSNAVARAGQNTGQKKHHRASQRVPMLASCLKRRPQHVV